MSLRLELTGGDVIELTDPEQGHPPGVARRLSPSGAARWSVAGAEGDVFVDLRTNGDEILVSSRLGLVLHVGLDDGVIRSVGYAA